jgi:hypothetical protein
MVQFLLIVILLVILIPLAIEAAFFVWFSITVFPDVFDLMLQSIRDIAN